MKVATAHSGAGIDFVHGANYTCGGTIFPHNIGMAATFDVARRGGPARSPRRGNASGAWNFAPVLDVSRQPLWPRFYGTYGEIPSLPRGSEALVAGSQASGHAGDAQATSATVFRGRTRPRRPSDRAQVREYILHHSRAAVRRERAP